MSRQTVRARNPVETQGEVSMPFSRSASLAVLAALLTNVAHAADPPRYVKVAAVQMRSTRDLAQNTKRIQESLARMAKEQVRIAVFPECALTGYSDDVKRLSEKEIEGAIAEVAAASQENHIAVILGTPVRRGGDLYNSAVVIDAAGRIKERYHKIQLAESWPITGDHLSVFWLDGVACSIIICHDERYPELVRLPVLAGARVIFYLSHESDLRQESKLGPYRAQIQARAVENTVFVVQANAPANPDTSGSHGQSRIMAPDGNIVQEASFFGEETIEATLDLKQATANNALRSLSQGPLRDWWAEGVKRVRVLTD
jgi:predicted amidohydrolase